MYHGLNSSLTCDFVFCFGQLSLLTLDLNALGLTLSSSLKSITPHYSTLVIHKLEHKPQSPVELVKTHIAGLIPSF